MFTVAERRKRRMVLFAVITALTHKMQVLLPSHLFYLEAGYIPSILHYSPSSYKRGKFKLPQVEEVFEYRLSVPS